MAEYSFVSLNTQNETSCATNTEYPMELRALLDKCSRREDFATICEQVVTAIQSEDVDSLLALSIAARQARSSMIRIEAPIEEALLTHGSAAINIAVRMKVATQRCTQGDNLLKKWKDRKLPPLEELLQTATGISLYVDSTLPLAWDYDEDLILLAGREMSTIASEFLRIGQKQILLYSPADEDELAYPNEVRIAKTVEDAYNIIRSLSRRPRRLIVRSRETQSISSEEYENLKSQAIMALKAGQVHVNTIDQFSELWLKQSIQNIPKLTTCPSITSLGQIFSGKPMVIIAPGPSLAKNIHLLKDLKGKALLVTFSHTMLPLLKEGIIPDVVITVDAQELQYHFEGIPIDEVPIMINALSVVPDIFELPAKHVFTIGANSYYDRWAFEMIGDPSALIVGGGSVATIAFILGVRWNCSAIIHVGLDLSIPDGNYYIPTSVDGDLHIAETINGGLRLEGWSDGWKEMINWSDPENHHLANHRKKTLPGYYGGEVTTNEHFVHYHDWFERSSKMVNDRIPILNCTEGGAYVKGMEHTPFANAIERYIASNEIFDVEEAVNQELQNYDNEEVKQKLVKGMQSIEATMNNCRVVSERGLSLLKRIESDPLASERLEETEEELSTLMAQIRFMSYMHQKGIDRALEKSRFATTKEETLRGSEELFTMIMESINTILPAVQDCNNRLQSNE